MALLATFRWVLLYLLQSPFVWLWAALLLAAWPMITLFSPLGLTTSDTAAEGALSEVFFLALIIGSLSGIAVLQRGGWFLRPIAPRRRLATEWAALCAASLPFFVAALVPPILMGGAAGGLSHGTLWVGVFLVHLHLSVVSLLLLRLPIPSAARLVALPLSVWVLPALTRPDNPVGAVVHHVLGAGRHLLPPGESVRTGAIWMGALGPIIGLTGLAYLVTRAPILLDEVRHPR